MVFLPLPPDLDDSNDEGVLEASGFWVTSGFYSVVQGDPQGLGLSQITRNDWATPKTSGSSAFSRTCPGTMAVWIHSTEDIPLTYRIFTEAQISECLVMYPIVSPLYLYHGWFHPKFLVL